MTRRLYFSIVGIGLIAWPTAARAQQTIFIVRHAEKLSTPPTDPGLSPDGKTRALTLRNMLKDADVKTIFASPFRRAKETAQPLATQLGLTVQEDPMADPQTLITSLRDLPTTGNVLIVGHSNTIPAFLKALGYTSALDIKEDEFDNLFIVTVGNVTRPRVARLYFKP